MNHNELFSLILGDRIDGFKRVVPSMFGFNSLLHFNDISVPEFLRNHPPLISAAVYYNSSKIIYYLVENGCGFRISDVIF